MRTLISTIIIVFFIVSCVSSPIPQVQAPQEVLIKIQGVDTVRVEKQGDSVVRSMEVGNPEGQLSFLTFTSGTKAFMKIFSGISISDVTHIWGDFCILKNNTKIREVEFYINSPGGDAFSGLALADLIERAQSQGFEIKAHASGIVASAAIPVFAVCDTRIASSGTVFMVHEASLWKWPGRETASDIRSQGELMDLLQERYINKLVDNTNLSEEEWKTMEYKTTWFNAEKALEWGLVDKIE